MSRRAVAAIVFLMAALALIVWPPAVDAHALLEKSDPPQGARLRTPPARVSAHFSEPLERGVSALRVVDGSGQSMTAGPTEVDPNDSTRMSIPLREGLPPGFYAVTWETLSRVDGHLWFGSYEFTILNPDGSTPAGPHAAATPAAVDSPATIAESALAKFAELAAVVVLVGSLAFALLVALPAAGTLSGEEMSSVRRAASRRMIVLALPAVVLLAAAGAMELILQARRIGDLGELGTVLGTAWGKRWIARQALLVVLAADVGWYARRGERDRRTGAVILWSVLAVALVYLLLVSAVSHAAAVRAGSFWATASDFVHLTTAAIWVGGLVQLALLFVWSRRAAPDEGRPPLLATALQRFSLLAATSGILLLSTGVFNALVHVSTLRAMVETAYGRALTVKLMLVLVLLAVAALNAVVFRPRLVHAAVAGGDVGPLRRRLSTLVRLEAALGLAVLAVTALLVQYPTARTLTETAAVQAPAGESAADTSATVGAGAATGSPARFAYPLAAGNWGTLVGAALIIGGGLAWVWARRRRARGRGARRLSAAAIGLPATGLVVFWIGLVVSAGQSGPSPQPAARAPATPQPQAGGTAPSPSGPFTATMALRYQAPDGRFVLLEIAPFQVGRNTFHVTVLDQNARPVAASGVTLRFSRLEREGAVGEAVAQPAPDGRFSAAEFALTETGWWVIDVDVDARPAVAFTLRLDQPSKAPLAFAPPDYQSDPAAEALFRKTLAGYEHLSSLRWREELTSGLLAPTGIGAWVITAGEGQAPDRVHLHVLSPGYSDYELYRVGDRSCTQPQGKPWQCTTLEREPAFDLEYQQPASAFRFGRQEMIDGELSRVVLFFNPTQSAWYAWWVGEDTGYLRRQAMVAPGHFMLLRFSDHNAPIEISLPPQAQGAR